LKRPEPSEYAPYYGRYIERVPDGSIVDVLRSQVRGTLDLLRSVPEAKGDYSYAPGKWSIKEVVGHVIDGERVFGYRALRIGRSDATPLPGFEQDDYVRAGGFAARSLRHLTEELETVRRATVLLYEGFREEDWSRKGTASGNPVTVRSLAHHRGP
jgi:hypothetical protein